MKAKQKTKAGQFRYSRYRQAAVTDVLSNYFEDNLNVAKIIAQKQLSPPGLGEAARQARELTKRKSALEITSLPGNLLTAPFGS